MNHEKSKQWGAIAATKIPGGVNSPVRSMKHVGIDPIYFAAGDGARLYDVDNNEYIDFCLSFGPHILGHSSPSVVRAIQEQAAKATSFGACHPKEVELAEWILKGYPFLDRVRLVNSGTEAVMTAIRVARGFTGRNKVLKFEGCYHGHSDGLLSKAGSGVASLSEATSKGVPPSVVADTLTVRFDDPHEIEAVFARHGKEIAAVVFEPVPANHGLWMPGKERIEKLCRLAKQHGALVFFDEVITGFRLGLSGATGYFGLSKDLVDLVSLGKITGGGLALAAVVGRKEIMDCLAPQGPVYQAGTLSGNPLGCAAGCAVMEELFQNPPYEGLEASTAAFTIALREVLRPWGEVQIKQVASLFWIHFGEESKAFPVEISKESAATYAKFFRAALDQGVYLPPSPYEVAFLSTRHTPDVLNSALERLERCKN